jgi:hypothetical protein
MWAIEVRVGGVWVEMDAVQSFDLAAEIVDEYVKEGHQARWRLRPKKRACMGSR